MDVWVDVKGHGRKYMERNKRNNMGLVRGNKGWAMS
jgi:hypothetical protein